MANQQDAIVRFDPNAIAKSSLIQINMERVALPLTQLHYISLSP